MLSLVLIPTVTVTVSYRVTSTVRDDVADFGLTDFRKCVVVMVIVITAVVIALLGYY